MLKEIPDLPPGKEYHVFVCYNKEDLNEVESIVEELENNGVVCCYYERDFKPGFKVLQNTHECMEKSLSILIVLSESSVNSRFCQHEIDIAVHMRVEKGYYIIPVKIEPCVVPECIRDVTYIDASEDVIADVPRKILRAITENEIFAEYSRDVNGECQSFHLSYTKTRSRYSRWLSYSRYNLKISYAERVFFIFNNNFQISPDLLDEIERIVNNSPAIRYRHVIENSKKIITCVFLVLLLTLFCIYNIVALATTSPTMQDSRMMTSLEVLLFGVPALFAIWIVIMCISCCCCCCECLYEKFSKAMNLRLIRYNFKICQDYFSRRCERYKDLQRFRRQGEAMKDYTDRMFDWYLSLNVGSLFQPEPFASPHERRHNMANKAICLCKLVEDWI